MPRTIELGIHLGHLLGDQTILHRGFPVAVEFEGYWLEPVERFTGLVHRLNVVFEPPGRVEDAHHVKLYRHTLLTWLPGSLAGSPKMLPMKQVLSRTAKGPAPGTPIAMLSLLTLAPKPVPALRPIAMLELPVLLKSAFVPTAVLKLPVLLLKSALLPTAVLSVPVVL